MTEDSACRGVSSADACCRDVWNAGLPLLQHDTRHHAKRAFNAAAAALAAVSSPLSDLRTRLHLEIAKCSLQADAPAALEEATRADGLDYVGNPSACERFCLERPWDRHLQPLVTSLRSRTQDRAPGAAIDPVDSAIQLIQRARETRTRTTRHERLLKAVAALEQVPLVQPAGSVAGGEGGGGPGEVEAGETEEERRERYRAARELTGLWGEVVKVAWLMQLYGIVLRAAPYVLWPAWNAAVDEEMAMLQVQSSSIGRTTHQSSGELRSRIVAGASLCVWSLGSWCVVVSSVREA